MAASMQHARAALRATALLLGLGLALSSLGCGGEVTAAADGTPGGGTTGGAGGASTTLCAPAASLDVSGVHFALIDLDKPIHTQMQMYLAMVDHADGLRARLSNADRTSICDGATCPSGEGCSANGCVVASQKAESLDEHPFFEPHPTPPTGYEVAFEACLFEEDGVAVLRSDSFDLVVESPEITLARTTIALHFHDPANPLYGDGSFAGDQLFLGASPSGPIEGTIVSRRLEGDEVPDDVPQP